MPCLFETPATPRLTLRLRTAAAAPSCNPKADVLSREANSRFSIAVKLEGYHDEARATPITISTNDSVSPQVSCALLTRCPAPLVAGPAFVAFGDLSSDSSRREVHEVRILGRGGKQLLQRDLPLRVREEGDWFKVVESARTLPEGYLSLSISIASHLPAGHLNGAIVISLAGSEESIYVPVTAHVVEPIGISPSTLYLRRKSDADTSLCGRLLLASHTGDALDGELTVLSGPLGVKISQEGDSTDPKRECYRVDVDENASWGPQEILKLEFRQKRNRSEKSPVHYVNLVKPTSR